MNKKITVPCWIDDAYIEFDPDTGDLTLFVSKLSMHQQRVPSDALTTLESFISTPGTKMRIAFHQGKVDFKIVSW